MTPNATSGQLLLTCDPARRSIYIMLLTSHLERSDPYLPESRR